MPHSVESHLGIEIRSYDATIRRWIPRYEEMVGVAAREAVHLGAGSLVDLGAGTGALSEAIFAAGFEGTMQLIDADPQMLDIARLRLARFAARVSFAEQSFLEPLPKCDGVVASLALHHVRALDMKRAVYRRIFDAVSANGFIVNADAAIPSEGVAREAAWRVWIDHMGAHGIDERTALENFAKWEEEDTYFPLEEEISAVSAAGFAAECVWHHGPMTVVVGRKRT